MHRLRHDLSRVPFALVVVLLLLPLTFVAAFAQEASPGDSPSLLAGLGLPALEVEITADGLTLPAEVPAGPVLLTASNATDGFMTVDVAQLPEGTTVEDYLKASNSDEVVPAWAADLVLAGGVAVPPGGTGSIVLNLAPGDWIVVAGGEVAVANPSAPLSVTEDAPAEIAIDAALDLQMGEYVFDFPDSIAAGPQIWHVTNSHSVLHHAVVFPVDRLYTAEEVQAGLMAEFTGTPAVGGFSMQTSVMGPPTDVPVMSGGQEIWVEANLQPGFYVAICFLSDPGSDGTPHAMMGMIDTFEATAP